ncbi:hypothetical protein BDZ94DRAFT_1275332 [Collybia nuda]|uniref:Uncharacterized protein n=1 Tax=Collybia nuda TaxID=64659 RepID=A0A9P5XT78_9AGAR|nr:hypothetical protein BDZ94DRAFT_1275332 [Collybia nuda]
MLNWATPICTFSSIPVFSSLYTTALLCHECQKTRARKFRKDQPLSGGHYHHGSTSARHGRLQHRQNIQTAFSILCFSVTGNKSLSTCVCLPPNFCYAHSLQA